MINCITPFVLSYPLYILYAIIIQAPLLMHLKLIKDDDPKTLTDITHLHAVYNLHVMVYLHECSLCLVHRNLKPASEVLV